MSAPTVRTAKEFLKIAKTATDPQNCQKVKAKVLLFQAGQDHTVRPGGENRFIEQIGERGQMVRIEKAKHEIYRCNNEDMELYWDAIEKFLG
jgi:alpha-beta hydrolase superfamily lysophospholipase